MMYSHFHNYQVPVPGIVVPGTSNATIGGVRKCRQFGFTFDFKDGLTIGLVSNLASRLISIMV